MSATMALATPTVLSWARERAGYSLDDIVAKMARKTVTKETIEAWENGEQQLTYAQLRRLAEIYRRPIAVFFLPSPPPTEPLKEKFRSLPEQYAEEIPPHIRFIVRDAYVKQMELAELHSDAGHTQTLSFPSVSSSSDVKKMAREVRDILGVSLEMQKKFKSADEAVKQWRRALEEAGLWIFKTSFNPRKKSADEQSENDLSDRSRYDGFYLPDDHFPVIYINNSVPQVRQIFTLFHELGHVLLNKGGVSFRSDMENKFPTPFDKDEVFCNAFAGEFLVPSSDLNLDKMPSDEEIKSYANRYKVSREVILRRCKDEKFITWEKYAAKVDAWKKEGKQSSSASAKGGPSFYTKQWAYLGEKYIALAFSQYYRKRISEDQLADYLGVKKINGLAKLESRLYPE